MVGLERSLAALYGRRELARQADCPSRICTYPGQKSWQIHDELFYKQGYDLPCPECLTVAGRAKWSRILGSELSIDDLDSIMRDRRERRACRERQQLYLKYQSQEWKDLVARERMECLERQQLRKDSIACGA